MELYNADWAKSEWYLEWVRLSKANVKYDDLTPHWICYSESGSIQYKFVTYK